MKSVCYSTVNQIGLRCGKIYKLDIVCYYVKIGFSNKYTGVCPWVTILVNGPNYSAISPSLHVIPLSTVLIYEGLIPLL